MWWSNPCSMIFVAIVAYFVFRGLLGVWRAYRRRYPSRGYVRRFVVYLFTGAPVDFGHGLVTIVVALYLLVCAAVRVVDVALRAGATEVSAIVRGEDDGSALPHSAADEPWA